MNAIVCRLKIRFQNGQFSIFKWYCSFYSFQSIQIKRIDLFSIWLWNINFWPLFSTLSLLFAIHCSVLNAHHEQYEHSLVIPIKFKPVKNDNKCIWLELQSLLAIEYRLRALQLTQMPKSSDRYILRLCVVTMIVGIVLCIIRRDSQCILSCRVSWYCVWVWTGVPCQPKSLHGTYRNMHYSMQQLK